MPRPLDDPSHEDVLESMEPGEPYTAGELTYRLGYEPAKRKTVHSRLGDLYGRGDIRRKKHPDTTGEIHENSPVTWWRPIDDNGE